MTRVFSKTKNRPACLYLYVKVKKKTEVKRAQYSERKENTEEREQRRKEGLESEPITSRAWTPATEFSEKNYHTHRKEKRVLVKKKEGRQRNRLRGKEKLTWSYEKKNIWCVELLPPHATDLFPNNQQEKKKRLSPREQEQFSHSSTQREGPEMRGLAALYCPT